METTDVAPEQATRPYGIVYLARNTVNGKGYVGQTVQSLNDRKMAHQGNARNGSSLPFHLAIRKHGEDTFTWDELGSCQNRDDLNAAEQTHIALLRTRSPHGYNLTNGGGGASLKTAYKISKAHIGKVHSAETRQKLREAWKRRKGAQIGR